LHAWQLTVPHPVTGEMLVLDSGLRWPAEPPDDNHPAQDWQRLLAGLPWVSDIQN
ncbi:MAG: pseudouridine synthase, partial [Burkholderiaceae bacterium]